jgi:GT2 family glycosyltransferase
MTRRDCFEQVGGLSTRYPENFNDVDYGLKLHSRGYRSVLAPDVELLHYESSSREAQVAVPEHARLHRDWLHLASDDPYYHPGFRASHHFIHPAYLRSGRFCPSGA